MCRKCLRKCTISQCHVHEPPRDEMVSQGPHKVSQWSRVGWYLCRLDLYSLLLHLVVTSFAYKSVTCLLVVSCDHPLWCLCVWLCVCWLLHLVVTQILFGSLWCWCWLLHLVGTCGEMLSGRVSVGCCILSLPIVFECMLRVCRLLQFVAFYVVWMPDTFVLLAARSRHLCG